MGAVPSRGGAALWLGTTGQADKHGPTLCAAGAGPCWQQGATNPQSVHDRETEDQVQKASFSKADITLLRHWPRNELESNYIRFSFLLK